MFIIPAFLAGIAYLFSRFLSDREAVVQRDQAALNREQAALDRRDEMKDQYREEIQQKYLDKMGELILEKKLIEEITKDEDTSSLILARGRTVSTLRLLDGDRQNILLNFLQEAQLISHILKGTIHNESNLSGVDLGEANQKESYYKAW